MLKNFKTKEKLCWRSYRFVKSLAEVTNSYIFGQENQKTKCCQLLNGCHQFFPHLCFEFLNKKWLWVHFHSTDGTWHPWLSVEGRVWLQVHNLQCRVLSSQSTEVAKVKERVVALRARKLNFILFLYLSCQPAVGAIKQLGIKLAKEYDL